MGYKMRINFSDGCSEILDEIFGTKEDAVEEYESWCENWSMGNETLMMAGEEYSNADIDDYDIWEV